MTVTTHQLGFRYFCCKDASERVRNTTKEDNDRNRSARLVIRRLVSTHLLFDLQLVDDRRQLRQNLVGLLVVFELGGDEVGEVAEGFGGVEDLL